ncbi:MAG: choice-of-anchor Q domain-containing protein, partial [Thermodesulfobacteriota bacterium]|nr:choice-of-anchor Q domain-containing protein [Thermodesulfobacteriota bacterium]
SGTPVTVQVATPGASTYRVFSINASGKVANIYDITIKGGDISAEAGGDGYGGGIYVGEGTLVLDAATVTGSRASHGGGIHAANSTTVSISDSTISENTAGGGGAGVRAVGATVTIDSSTLSNNILQNAAPHNGGQGGGAIRATDSTCTIVNSTLSGNTAVWTYGSAIQQDGTTGALYVIDSTVSNNSVYYCHGVPDEAVSIRTGAACILNSIIINNQKTADPAGLSYDIGGGGTIYSYYSWYARASSGVSDQANAPNVTTAYTADDLGPLQDNGGPTFTMAVGGGTPIITEGTIVHFNETDGYYFFAGDSQYHKLADYSTFSPGNPENDHIELDQRGATRHGAPTMGAYEYYADYRSQADGNWGDTSTWEVFNGISYSAASEPPTAENSTAIAVNHDVTVNVDVTVDQTTIAAGQTLTVGSVQTLTVADGSGDDLIATGSLDIDGGLRIGTGTVDADGSLDASGGTIIFSDAGHLKVGGATVTSLGSLSADNGTVWYDLAGDQTILANTYYSLRTDGFGTKTLVDTVDINGNLTIGAGTTLDVSSYGINIAGNLANSGDLSINTGTVDADGDFDATGGSVTFIGEGALYLGGTVTSLGTFTAGTGTVTYDGGNQAIVAGTYYNLLLGGSSDKTASDSISTNNTFTNTRALTISGANKDLSVTGPSSIGANVTTTGNQIYTGAVTLTDDVAFTSSSGDILFSSSVEGQASARHMTVDVSSGHKASIGADMTINIGTITKQGAGDFDTNGNDVTATGLSVLAGTFNAEGASGDWDINGNVSIDGGTLTGTSGNFNFSGSSWSVVGGTVAHNGGTVVFDGTNQALTGSTAFNNLTKNVSSADTLTFQAGSTTTIAGTLDLKGTPGALLSLRSDSDGDQWEIDPQGTRTISYVDVKDSNNVSGDAISAGATSVDSGHNTGWAFQEAPTVTTQPVTGTKSSSATGNGNITDLGVPNPTSHGVVWNTAGEPTLDNNSTDEGPATVTGGFTSTMTGLTPNTTYAVRAYATNAEDTAYGNEVSFTTLPSALAPLYYLLNKEEQEPNQRGGR